MDDDLIGYIKGSLDGLHVKVDKINEDTDKRLKVLEIKEAHKTGYIKAAGTMASFVCALIGGILSAVVSWLIYNPKQ